MCERWQTAGQRDVSRALTGGRVVGDEAQDVSRFPVDVEAHGQFTERELHHEVGVAIG